MGGEAFDVGFHQLDGYLVVERDEDGIALQHRFGLRVEFRALFGCGACGQCGVERLVEDGVVVEETVVRAVGAEGVEHARRFVVVGTPASERDGEIARLARVQIGFPFLVDQVGLDEGYGGFPDGLQRGNLLARGFVGAVEHFEGQRVGLVEARFVQQAHGFGGFFLFAPILPVGRGLGDALHFGRGELEGGHVAPAADFGNDGAVGEHIERAAHFRVVEGEGFVVRFEIEGAQEGGFAHLAGEFLVSGFDLVGRNAVGHIGFACAVAVEFVGRGQEHDFGYGHGGFVVIGGIFFQQDVAVDAPFFQFVCAADDIVFRLRPFVAVFFHRGFVHGVDPRLDEHVGEIGHGHAEGELQGFFVEGADAKCFGLGFAGEHFFGVDDFAVGQIAGVGRAGFGVGQAAQAIDEIVGGDRVAI